MSFCSPSPANGGIYFCPSNGTDYKGNLYCLSVLIVCRAFLVYAFNCTRRESPFQGKHSACWNIESVFVILIQIDVKTTGQTSAPKKVTCTMLDYFSVIYCCYYIPKRSCKTWSVMYHLSCKFVFRKSGIYQERCAPSLLFYSWLHFKSAVMPPHAA